MQEDIAKASGLAEGFRGVDRSLLDAVVQAMAPVVVSPPDEMLEGVKNLGALMSAVDGAVETAVPLTPANPKERFDLLLRFSIDPKGLGLSEQEFHEMEFHEWLARYKLWEIARHEAFAPKKSRLPNKGGRPFEERTRSILMSWRALGNPKPSARICDKIGAAVYPDELKGFLPGSLQHKRVRERVRQAIKRHLAIAAT
jgi:hypothetical protein